MNQLYVSLVGAVSLHGYYVYVDNLAAILYAWGILLPAEMFQRMWCQCVAQKAVEYLATYNYL